MTIEGGCPGEIRRSFFRRFLAGMKTGFGRRIIERKQPLSADFSSNPVRHRDSASVCAEKTDIFVLASQDNWVSTNHQRLDDYGGSHPHYVANPHHLHQFASSPNCVNPGVRAMRSKLSQVLVDLDVEKVIEQREKRLANDPDAMDGILAGYNPDGSHEDSLIRW